MCSQHSEYMRAIRIAQDNQQSDTENQYDFSDLDAPVGLPSEQVKQQGNQDAFDFSAFDQPIESTGTQIRPGEDVIEPEDDFLSSNIALFGEEPEPLGEIVQAVYEFTPAFSVSGYDFSRADLSYNTFLYLQSLGYKYAQWNLSAYRGRILYDVCDVYSGRWFTIEGLLNDSLIHKEENGQTPGNWKPHKAYDPASPIFAESHPGCRCTLTCIKPRTIGEIPATAPGVPISSERRLVLDARRNLLNTLTDEIVSAHTYIDPDQARQLQMVTMPDIMNQLALEALNEPEAKMVSRQVSPEAKKYQIKRHVTKWSPTYAEPTFYANTAEAIEGDIYASSNQIIKFAQSSIEPIEIAESFLYLSRQHLVTPIPRGYRGFLLKIGDQSSLCYLLQLNNIVEIPNTFIKVLKLRPSKYNKSNIYGGMFVYVDDILGITFKVYGDKMAARYALVYLADMQTIVEVKEWTPLERI